MARRTPQPLRALVTGASGMLGYALCREASAQGWDLVAVGRKNRHNLPNSNFVSLDLTSVDDLLALLAVYQPNLVVHAAAQTNYHLCESDPKGVRALHVDLSRMLARAQHSIRGRFIHVSTDAVYGKGIGLHVETGACNPKGVYAETKLEGEAAVLAEHPGALVLRATPVGFSPSLLGATLVEWLIRSFQAGQSVNGYVDALFTPVSSFQFARFVFSKECGAAHGILNVGCLKPLSKYEIAAGLCRRMGYDASLVRAVNAPVTMSGSAALDSTKVVELTGWQMQSPENVFDDLVGEFKILFHS